MAPKKERTRAVAVGVAILGMVGYLALDVGGKKAGASMGRHRAMVEVEGEARRVGGPTGLFGAKWLMSPAEVRRVRPNATHVSDDQLLETVQAFDRSSNVGYFFDNDYLLIIVVTFNDVDPRGAIGQYMRTQRHLGEAYGSMPSPQPSERYQLDSSKKMGRFSVQHLLYEGQGILKEQVLLFRTEG